jgi:hypothetical protein
MLRQILAEMRKTNTVEEEDEGAAQTNTSDKEDESIHMSYNYREETRINKWKY